jgi:hypothetical protein
MPISESVRALRKSQRHPANAGSGVFQRHGGALKVIRWEVGQANEFDRTLTPEEIMDKLEQRVGPEGRKLFRLAIHAS